MTSDVIVKTSDGVRLAVRSVGEGVPIVFVHEFTGNAASWDPQLAAFARRYRCVTCSARGYPPSEVPDDLARYSQARAADDVADVIRGLSLGPAHVVGLSMGGFATLHFGLRHPELARSLVLAGVGYGSRPEAQPAYGEKNRADADDVEARGIETFADECAASGYAQPLRAKDPLAWEKFARELRAHSARGTAQTLRGVLAERPSLWHLEPQLKALRLPVLIVNGDEDAPCLEPGLYLKQTIPDAALAVMPRAGHLLNLEDPGRFNALVGDFVSAVDAGRWSGWRGATQ